MEINIGITDTFIRLRIPKTWSAWKYSLKNPKSFVIGVYGFKRFRKQQLTILKQQAQIRDLEILNAKKNEQLKRIGKELSVLKRGKTS